jgi:hypothetical protein
MEPHNSSDSFGWRYEVYPFFRRLCKDLKDHSAATKEAYHKNLLQFLANLKEPYDVQRFTLMSNCNFRELNEELKKKYNVRLHKEGEGMYLRKA